ncbi:MAG TPA: hypothetical protein VL326_07310 [Kofleriaceae bacterium]|nr:hypothetical protein [Kofleriaceae bacterium]
MKGSLVRLACLAAVAAPLLDATSASAQPEVRDHRTEAPPPAPPPAGPGPEVRDHRSGEPVRYRRRPGPRFMMPLKVDIGAAFANTSRGFGSGVGAAIGIHWASLSPNPTQTDVGIGVFGALLGAPKDPMGMNDNNVAAYGGAYLEAGHTLSHGNWWRTWLTGRGEYLGSKAFDQPDHVGFGASGRLSAELFVSGVGIEPRGLFLGTYALGVYLEGGVRDTADEIGKVHFGGGLTFRTPLVFAP